MTRLLNMIWGFLLTTLLTLLIAPAVSASMPMTFGLYASNSGQGVNGTIKPSYYSQFGMTPDAAIYYGSWGSLNPVISYTFMSQAHAQHIMPFIELQTGSDSMTSIINGKYDSDLIAFGQHVQKDGYHILMTFDHEMNGNWAPWGYNGSNHDTPTQWIESWNHVTSIINREAPRLVTWVWAPNVEVRGSAVPVKYYWSYNGVTVRNVNEIGLDGYLCLTQTTGSCGQTFPAVFAGTVKDIRGFSGLPLIVAETAIGAPVNRGPEIRAMVTAARSEGFHGMYWFDVRQYFLNRTDSETYVRSLGW